MPQKWLIRENARENISPDNKKEACNHCGYRLLPWYARRDSNPQPSEPESDALSNCATGAFLNVPDYYSSLFLVCKEKISHSMQLEKSNTYHKIFSKNLCQEISAKKFPKARAAVVPPKIFRG